MRATTNMLFVRRDATTLCVHSCALINACCIVGFLYLQSTVYRNLPYPEVFKHEVEQKEGETTANGTFCVSTGAFTGRSPKDKYFVKQVRSFFQVGR